jgi:hypothetical protein
MFGKSRSATWLLPSELPHQIELGCIISLAAALPLQLIATVLYEQPNPILSQIGVFSHRLSVALAFIAYLYFLEKLLLTIAVARNDDPSTLRLALLDQQLGDAGRKHADLLAGHRVRDVAHLRQHAPREFQVGPYRIAFTSGSSVVRST